MSQNNSTSDLNENNILYENCVPNWPTETCAFANICGFISSVIWFLVLLPQLYRNFRWRTVEGLSFGWALANFTAAMNNAFFVFKLGTLPLFSQISAVYMPVTEGLIMLQFWLFTPFSRIKILISGTCILLWITIAALQIFLSVYDWMQWISVVLWSIESFPQVFLNAERKSTFGLSLAMVLLTAVGKTTDFCSNYLLVMPMQNVVMCYFSSSVAYVVTLQVILYWKRQPLDNKRSKTLPDQENQVKHEKDDKKKISPTCNVIRILLTVYFFSLLLCFAIGIVLKTGTCLALLAPFCLAAVLLSAFVYYYTYCGVRLQNIFNNLSSCKLAIK